MGSKIAPVLTKDERVRMCVDLKDLNKASLKDDFPAPHIYVLVDNTVSHALVSFRMDAQATIRFR